MTSLPAEQMSHLTKQTLQLSEKTSPFIKQTSHLSEQTLHVSEQNLFVIEQMNVGYVKTVNRVINATHDATELKDTDSNQNIQVTKSSQACNAIFTNDGNYCV